MRSFAAGFALALALPALAFAEPALDGAPIAGRTVFLAFHEKPGLDRIVADLLTHAQTDPRITDIFKAADMERLHSQLVDQLCRLAGGGCSYEGKDMKTAHKDMGLQDADLNALVENLQDAMDREGVPFSAQNQLLAKLAPMRRLVVVH